MTTVAGPSEGAPIGTRGDGAAEGGGVRRFLERWRLASEFHARFAALDEARAGFVRDFTAVRGRFDGVELVRGALSAAAETELLAVGDATLFEHRSGARAGSGAGPDGLTGIDVGRLLVTTRRIGFVGTRVTRSVEYRRALEIRVDQDRLKVSPASRARTWQVRMSEEDAARVEAVVQLAFVSPTRRLDSQHGHGHPGHWFDAEVEDWMHLAARTIARGEQEVLDLHDQLVAHVEAHPEVDFPEFQFGLSYEVSDDLRALIDAYRGAPVDPADPAEPSEPSWTEDPDDAGAISTDPD